MKRCLVEQNIFVDLFCIIFVSPMCVMFYLLYFMHIILKLFKLNIYAFLNYDRSCFGKHEVCGLHVECRGFSKFNVSVLSHLLT